MERCVHIRLYNYVTVNNILTSLQSGFVKGDSPTHQLLNTYHTVCEAVDCGKEIRAVFCDISKVSDRVWHNSLLHKLSAICCSDKVLCWFCSYLSGHKQRVVVGSQASDWASVEAGVSQGSILGPLLFLIYINDIIRDIGATIRLFVDDISLYIVVDSLPSTTVLNTDLSTIGNWADAWLPQLHAGKTFSMITENRHLCTLR